MQPITADRSDHMFDRRFLLALIIPLFFEQLLAVTIGMADTMMVASVGEAAVSSVSLVDAITNLVITLFAAFATGGAVVASQYLGRKLYVEANRAAKQLLMLSLAVSTGLLLLAMPFRTPIIRFIFGQIDDTVLHFSSQYFFFILLSFPFLAVYNASAALFRSMGNSRVSLWVSVAMNLTNIGGNAYFIFVQKMGVAGAGLSTLLSRVLGALIMLILIRGESNQIRVRSLHRFRFQKEMISRILRIGVPTGIENSLFHLGRLIVQTFVSTFGTAAIAANAISGTVSSFINIPGWAISLASITIIGQAVGAQRYDEATYWGKRLIGISYFLLVVLAIPGIYFAPLMASLFNLSPPAQEMAIILIRSSMVCTVLAWPTSFLIPNFLRAAGDAKFTMAISLFSMWSFRVVFSYLLAIKLGWGVYGVWIGMYIDWFVRSGFFAIRFARGKWKRHAVI